MKRYLLAILLSMAPAVGVAQAFQQFGEREPVTQRADTALVLYRSDGLAKASRHGLAYGGGFDFILVREEAIASIRTTADSTSEGVRSARAAKSEAATASEPNVYRTNAHKDYDRVGEDQTYIIALPPGRYVVAAATPTGISAMGTCFCMGTVAFEAKAGIVTDLGYLLATWEDRPTKIPELAASVNPAMSRPVLPPLIAATVRPVSNSTPVPEPIRDLPKEAADYRAIGKFPNYFHSIINRMAPVAAVLAYDGDKVIDLKAH